ncbi:hypothetical protein, partial [Fodinicola feengrottensis]|uniref:hypothetical protein n=1 Tax=Fodinicola feengrottensis TaxID=435914 RepID=UPI002441C0FB
SADSATQVVCLNTRRAARIFGLSLNDPLTSFFNADFRCQFQLGEMVAPAPLQVVLILTAVIVVLWLGNALHRMYAAAVLVGGLLVINILAYQVWINRLLMPLMLLALLLLPVAVSLLAAKRPWLREYRLAIGGALVALVMIGGAEAMAFGDPRPAYRLGILFSQPADPVPSLLPSTRALVAGIEQVKKSGAKVVGLSEFENSQEYAIWVGLGASQDKVRLVAMKSVIPKLQEDTSQVDAVLCVQVKVSDCADVLPAGWNVQVHTDPESSVIAVVALSPKLATSAPGSGAGQPGSGKLPR